MSRLAVAAPCWARIARDPDGVPTAVLLDYWGDAPPEGVLAALADRGWDAPLPAAPPAQAIEWRAQVDPATGGRWTLRPYAVTDALAVARPGADTDPVGLDRLLRGLGAAVADEAVPSLSVPAESAPGRATVDQDGEVGPDAASRPPVRAWVLGDVPAPGDEARGVPGEAEASPAVAPVQCLDGSPPLPATHPASSPTIVAAPRSDPAGPPATTPVTRRLFGPAGVAATRAPGGEGGGPAPAVGPPVRIVHAVVRTGSVAAIGRVLAGFDLADLASIGTATGAGREGGQVVTYRGTRTSQLYPRSWIDVPVPTALVDDVIGGIVAAIRIGREGDGKVWVT